jgi:hypothetical protein
VPWPLPASDSARLALAKSYPFPAPGRSYLFRDGTAEPLESGESGESGSSQSALFTGRQPVIGHGSNRSPEQLHRKYGSGAEIPVSRAWLADYDVVYSAHVTQYGSIAANLQHTPGALAEVYVTWLTVDQLGRMHETELGGENYFYGRLNGVSLTLEAGPVAELAAPNVYLSTRGCLARDGGPVGLAPIGLAAVASKGRPHPELHQEGALDLVRARHRPERALDPHILETIRDPQGRKALVAEMEAHAVPAEAPHFEVLKGP